MYSILFYNKKYKLKMHLFMFQNQRIFHFFDSACGLNANGWRVYIALYCAEGVQGGAVEAGKDYELEVASVVFGCVFTGADAQSEAL